MMGTEQHDRQQILDLVKQYYEDHKKESEEFHEGDRIGYAGRVFDSEEMVNLVDSALDFWLTAGRYCKEFENELLLGLVTLRQEVGFISRNKTSYKRK